MDVSKRPLSNGKWLSALFSEDRGTPSILENSLSDKQYVFALSQVKFPLILRGRSGGASLRCCTDGVVYRARASASSLILSPQTGLTVFVSLISAPFLLGLNLALFSWMGYTEREVSQMW